MPAWVHRKQYQEGGSATPDDSKDHPWKTATWVTIAIVSVIWWIIAGRWSLERSILVVWLSLSSFMVGSLVGFLFSSYGDESNTVGKIRDWLIGGITALTVSNAAAIKGVLLLFATGPESVEFAVTIAAAVFYAGLGFFFMFFQRELILNVLLAQSRAERDRVEGTREAGQVIQRLLVSLPPSILSGVDYVDEIPAVNEQEAQSLKNSIYSPDVEKFILQADEATKRCAADWDVVSKAAYITYYRTYFEKENRRSAIDKALVWITRALNMNPMHIDLTMKYADMLSANEDYGSAAGILDRLAMQPEAPMLVKEWLGYVLRFLPHRLDDAIRYSEEYHRLFPDESDTFFNVAYAYAHKYSEELRASGKTEDLQSLSRQNALSMLKEALRLQADMTETVRTEWTKKGEPLECFLHDKEFRSLVGLQAEQSVGGTA